MRGADCLLDQADHVVGLSAGVIRRRCSMGAVTGVRCLQLAQARRCTLWSGPLRMTRVARPRVGATFSTRLGLLMVRQRVPARSRGPPPPRPGCTCGSTRTGSGRPSRGAAEAVEVPALDVLGAGVDVHAEVEVVGETDAGAAVGAGEGGLQDVQALDDEDVGAADREPLVGDDVVDQVGVDRAP